MNIQSLGYKFNAFLRQLSFNSCLIELKSTSQRNNNLTEKRGSKTSTVKVREVFKNEGDKNVKNEANTFSFPLEGTAQVLLRTTNECYIYNIYNIYNNQKKVSKDNFIINKEVLG
jgi:hypothetical protein